MDLAFIEGKERGVSNGHIGPRFQTLDLFPVSFSNRRGMIFEVTTIW